MTNPYAKFHRQRGAIGLFGTLTLLLAILFTALVVDSGRLWMQQRKLQSIADIASIEAARYMGCAANLADVLAAAQAAAVKNGYAGQLADSPNVVELGQVSVVNGIRQFSAASGQEAVRVFATQQVPASLVVGGLFGNLVTLRANAVSSADPPLATFSAGSFAARMDEEDATLLNALLSDLLGGTVNLDVLSYRGLAASQVSLGDLLEARGEAGGIEGLLNADMQLGELLNLVASAVTQSEVADAQAAAASQQLAAATISNLSLQLADVIAVSAPDQEAAARVGINVLSLINTAAMVANSQHAISVPLNVNVPGISSVSGTVTIVEAPQMAMGPPGGEEGNLCTSVHTAQVRAAVNVLVEIPLLARLDLALHMDIAQGSAGLLDLSDDGENALAAIIASPGIAALRLSNTAGNGPARISSLLNVPLADILLNLPLQPATPQQLDFSVAHPVAENLPQTQSVSSPLGDSLQNALSSPNALNVTVLSVINTALVNTVVTTVVSPLLGEIGRLLLDPLVELLGIRPGGMDVTLEGIQLRQMKPLII